MQEEVKVSMRDLPVADPLGLVKGDLREYDSLNAGKTRVDCYVLIYPISSPNAQVLVM